MYSGKMVLSQIMEFFPMYEFQKCVKRYQGNYKVKNFSCWEQFLCMAFAQLTYRESLRDIETCLRSMKNKLYHMGIRSQISRNTLSNANNQRDWRIYADFAQVLIHTARDLYLNDDFGVELENAVYALDATTIDLCLSLFPWARFRKNKAGIKMHTLLDLHGNIPTFIEITEALLHDQYSRYPRRGIRLFLCHGSRLYRFRQALFLESLWRFFYRSCQKEFQIQKTLFPQSRQIYRFEVRSNNRIS